jgi:hypothetical protein
MLPHCQPAWLGEAHPVVVRVDKGAEEEELDGRLKAKHWLLGDRGRKLALGCSIALLCTHTKHSGQKQQTKTAVSSSRP